MLNHCLYDLCIRRQPELKNQYRSHYDIQRVKVEGIQQDKDFIGPTAFPGFKLPKKRERTNILSESL